MLFEGEIYFNNLVTLGKELPFLPIDIRKKILSYILYTMSCLTCNEVIISLKPHFIQYTDGYSILNGYVICRECKINNLIN